MKIGGYQKTSLIDYPGKVAAVIFTSGCNFRCPYCHNRDLVLARPKGGFFEASEVLRDLKDRRKFLDGVVLTGGEPTLQGGLLEFVYKIARSGLFVKVDTNGSNPSILREMIEKKLLDYVALDIKAPLDERYETVSKCQSINVSRIKKALNLLLESDVQYELRTTVVPGMHLEKDILDLGKQLSEMASEAKWFLQNFQPKNCLDPEFENIEPYDRMFLEKLVEKLRARMPNVGLRG